MVISVNSAQVPLVIIDSIYYGKFVFAPWNILLYNVFGKGGPDLYGTYMYIRSTHLSQLVSCCLIYYLHSESHCVNSYHLRLTLFFHLSSLLAGVEPWSFYFINGFLNFNIIFPLALLAAPLIEFHVSHSQ